MQDAVRTKVFADKILKGVNVATPDVVLNVVVPENVPVGDNDNIIEYGPLSDSILVPA